MKTRLLSLLALAIALPAGAVEVVRTERYVDYKMNLAEMRDEQQLEAFGTYRDLLGRRLAEILPAGPLERHLQESLSAIRTDEAQLNQLFSQALAQGRLISHSPGVRRSDLMPIGFFVVFGTRLSGNLLAGVGADASVGMFVMPQFVQRIDLAAKTISQHWEFDWSLIGWPVGSVGAGLGGGGKGRFGVGIVWGPMNSADEFHGFAAALSGDLNLGAGGFWKAGLIRRNGRFRNLFVMAGVDLGASASLEFHGNVSMILGGEQVMQMLSQLSGSEAPTVPTSGIDIVPTNP